jgi:hypothetical protein
MEMDFEFALISDPALSSVGNYSSFARKFTGNPIAVFENLRGDATLIVPEPPADGAQYPHLQAFLQSADWTTADELWSRVADAAFKRLKRDQHVWVSTAGLGVPWLHFRIDTRPKYICHVPYRREG